MLPPSFKTAYGSLRLLQTLPGVDAGLAASVFHFGEIAIPHLKAQLRQAGISVR